MSTLELNVKAKEKQKTDWNTLLNPYLLQKTMVGSKFICDPAPVDTDEDWLCWVEKPEKATKALEAYGWKVDGKDTYNMENFVSLKHPDSNINIILTGFAIWFNRFKVAAKVCKKLNILDKKMRIWIHEQVINS